MLAYIFTELKKHFCENNITHGLLFIFQTIQWVDPDVDCLWSVMWALQEEVKEMKKKMNKKTYVRPEVVYLRPKKNKIKSLKTWIIFYCGLTG